jgi:hypothetical protein
MSLICFIHRMGRPVTMTNGTPAASTAVSEATVRAEMAPSDRTTVPSRSLATRRGDQSGDRSDDRTDTVTAQ